MVSVELTCLTCGNAFQIERMNRPGRWPNYCSNECRKLSKTKPTIPCTACGKLLYRGSGAKPPAERRCRDCGWAKPKPEKPPPNCTECGKETNRQFCRYGIRLCQDCAKKREKRRWRDKKRSRRAVKAGLPRTKYTTEEIAERSHFKCGICEKRVDMSLSGMDSMGPTIDHIVPISLGGWDTPDNVQLAHRVCNMSKRAEFLVF